MAVKKRKARRRADTGERRKAGRHRNQLEKAQRVLDTALEGEEVNNLLKELNAAELELFNQMVEDYRNTGAYPADLWNIDYIKRPPTMEEFIMDDYWMGKNLKTSEENQGLFPIWKDILIKDFDLDSRLNNVVFTGSLGIGKSYVMSAIFLYKIAVTRLLRNPQHFYGLSGTSSIFYVMLSVTKGVISDTVFGDLQSFMANSPFFIEECRYDPDMKYSDFRIPLGKNVFLSAGSKGWHMIGRNVMGIGLDEGNWRNETNPDLKAYALYDEARTRIQNRFQRMKGFSPAISMMASSAKDESSFTERVIAEIAQASPVQERVYRFPVYVVRDFNGQFDKQRWFRVTHGLKSVEPEVLPGWYAKDKTPIEPGPEPGVGLQVEYVPEQYMDAFRRNIYTALQSVAGISIGGDHKLFSSMVDWEQCKYLAQNAGLVNPCTVEHIPLSSEDDKEIWDFLDHPRFLTRRNSRVLPIRDDTALRFAHIDLATTTQAGVAIGHVAGKKLVQGLVSQETGAPFEEYRLVFEYDFILSIVAGKRKPINFEKIQRFFFWLRDKGGYQFGLVTADMFNSEMPLQMMEARGFKVGRLSLDKTKDPYYSWRSGFEEHRILIFPHKPLEAEAEELLDGPKKIDHKPEKSKDVTDGAAGAYYNALSSDSIKVSQYGHEPGLYPALSGSEMHEEPPVQVDTTPPPLTPRSFDL